MTKFTVLSIPLLFTLYGCAPSSQVNLSDINPKRTYQAGFEDLIDAVKIYSLKEGFRLDRSSEEAGRVIGHKNTSSASVQGREFSVATTAMMIIMNLKMTRISNDETEMTVHFAFESGHVYVTKEEEGMLVECYSTLLAYLDEKFQRAGMRKPA